MKAAKKTPRVNEDQPVQLTAAPQGYADLLNELKTQIHDAQQRATQAINLELVSLYWRIGYTILSRQETQGWGAKVVDRLAHDLRSAFPDMQGFSVRNLKYMRAFAQSWTDLQFVQQLLHKLPWGHNLVLLEKLSTQEERRWYAANAIEHNWSRNILVMQIETRLLERTPSACYCAKAKTRWLRNTPWVTKTSRWAWLNTNCWNPCPQSCKLTCPASSRLSVS